MAGDLCSTLADLKEKEALSIVKDRLSAGDDPMSILDDARRAMEIVGKRFADSQYFIPDLVYSGEILKTINEIVKPKLVKAAESKRLAAPHRRGSSPAPRSGSTPAPRNRTE